MFRFCHVGFVQHFTSRSLHAGLDKKTVAFILSLFFVAATGTRFLIAFVGNLKFVSVQVIYIIGVAMAGLSNILMVALPSMYGPLISAITFGISIGEQ